MSFFILGLPRSRTAWLANFMTYGRHHCYHDGINGCTTMQEYKDKLGPRIGDANTALAMLDFRKHFPYAKTVIIDSDITNSIGYGQQHYKMDFTTNMINMKAKLDSIDGLHVPLANLDLHLKDIWDYLTNCEVYDYRRAELLKGFDIKMKEPATVDGPSFMQLMESLKCQL